MNVSDLREKTVDELNAELDRLAEEQFRLRTQQAMGQLGQTHLLAAARKDVARIKTVLNEKAGN